MMLAALIAGEIFGEIAMLDGKERTADARAASECRLAVLYRRDVLSFFEKHPNAWAGLVGTLCERLRNADEQMAEIALMGLPVRLAKALLRMTAIEPQTGKHLSQVRLSQREIGSLVGATRESVNKWLGRWQRKDILQIAESLIIIADRHALEELAQLGSTREFRPLGTADSTDDSSRTARFRWNENSNLEKRARKLWRADVSGRESGHAWRCESGPKTEIGASSSPSA